jgi:hypothetical protein
MSWPEFPPALLRPRSARRIVEGADAGRFVSAIKARLEEGAFEADLGL